MSSFPFHQRSKPSVCGHCGAPTRRIYPSTKLHGILQLLSTAVPQHYDEGKDTRYTRDAVASKLRISGPYASCALNRAEDLGLVAWVPVRVNGHNRTLHCWHLTARGVRVRDGLNALPGK